jgi:hypothetical protein
VGEVNEVREILRRCLAGQIRLDDVEILVADSATYIPLMHGIARRYFSEPDRPEGVPITFAEGLPASLSRPGRALAAWLRWVGDGCSQRLLVEMILEGLLQIETKEEISFRFLAGLLRPIAVGRGAENYLPKLDEQIAALKAAPHHAGEDGESEAQSAARRLRLQGLVALRRLAARLLKLTRSVTRGDSSSVLDAAQQFLTKTARAVNELDRYAAEALLEKIQERRAWLDRLGVHADPGNWLAALPQQTRILGSGPKPGYLHVAPIDAGGHSGRNHTFVLGSRFRIPSCWIASGRASARTCRPAPRA